MSRAAVRRSVRSPVGLDLLGVAGVVGVFLLIWRTSAFTAFLYPAGFILLSVATVAMVAAVVNPSSRLGSVLGCRPSSPRPSAARVAPATQTSCRSVVYIGDSTSEGQVSTEYIPNPRLRLQAELAKVGVRMTYPEISGARSIVETFEGHPNAATVAQQHISEGFHGCWILALGTNDVDNAQTSPIGLPARIAHMMASIGHQPVLWVDVISLLSSGPYSEHQMQRWNEALLAACPHHPAMRVYDWAAHAKRKWFIPDGIHYYSPGYVARDRLIAHGLAKAFPKGQPASTSCVVR